MERENTLLMIVDYQERLVPTIHENQKILTQAQQVIQAFEIFGIPMVVTEQYPKGLGQTVAEIKNCLNERVPVFEKLSFSAYLPEIQTLLQEKAVKDVVLIGMETHVCVYQTCKELLQDGYKVHVVKETVGSRIAENAQNGFELMRKLGASVTNKETIIYEIMKVAGTEEFKKILKIVK
ncbi:isochorismatase family protein [Enterococcus olivae]